LHQGLKFSARPAQRLDAFQLIASRKAERVHFVFVRHIEPRGIIDKELGETSPPCATTLRRCLVPSGGVVY
jgi:hypothetical protein